MIHFMHAALFNDDHFEIQDPVDLYLCDFVSFFALYRGNSSEAFKAQDAPAGFAVRS